MYYCIYDGEAGLGRNCYICENSKESCGSCMIAISRCGDRFLVNELGLRVIIGVWLYCELLNLIDWGLMNF